MKRIAMQLAMISLVSAFSSEVVAFNCFITVVKDSCWTEKEVTVDMTDLHTGKLLVSNTVAKGKEWGRKEFTCTEGQKINYTSGFTPHDWSAEKDKHYPGKMIWTLPATLPSDDTAWSLTLCFPEQFSGVPFPSTNKTTCGCNTQNVPAVKP